MIIVVMKKNNKIKIAFFDIDWTLYDHGKNPKAFTKSSIKDIEKPLNFVRMNVLALLFNLGFMTIKSKNTKSYELTFVNSEAIDSLKDSFLNNDNRDLDNVFTRFNPDFRFV